MRSAVTAADAAWSQQPAGGGGAPATRNATNNNGSSNNNKTAPPTKVAVAQIVPLMVSFVLGVLLTSNMMKVECQRNEAEELHQMHVVNTAPNPSMIPTRSPTIREGSTTANPTTGSTGTPTFSSDDKVRFGFNTEDLLETVYHWPSSNANSAPQRKNPAVLKESETGERCVMQQEGGGGARDMYGIHLPPHDAHARAPRTTT
jgi:hypothetical protein